MNEQIDPAKSRGGRPPRRELYRRLHAEAAELRERLGGLPRPEETVDIWRGIWYEEAHHSTAIEGNTLLLRQVERLLADGVAVGNRELREYLEVRGYGSAAEWVYRQALDPAGLFHPGEILRFVIPAVAGPARLVPLAALADQDLTAPALRMAAARGRLKAVRGPDGRWRSSRRWIEEYQTSRYRRDRAE